MFYAPHERSRSHHPADSRPIERRFHHPDLTRLQGWRSMKAEADLPEKGWDEERRWALRMGLTGADSIEDKSIPTFARGELPHYAGINTFLKAPYAEDVTEVGDYDATVLGIPFDGGTTYRPGTRFGPQGLRKISALCTPYNYEMAVDLREQMSLCDAGDVFTIPANIEKSFDQISRAVSHVASSGSFPIMIGGDHSIGFPCVRGIAECTSKKIGIIHFDRHADIQEKDLDERMHTTPWFHATNMPNVPAKNLVQIGIGGWQVPREAVALASRVAAEGLCGIELVEVSPPYDTSDITALLGTRVIVDVLGSTVAAGKLGAHKRHIDKPVKVPHGEFEGKRWSNAT